MYLSGERPKASADCPKNFIGELNPNNFNIPNSRNSSDDESGTLLRLICFLFCFFSLSLYIYVYVYIYTCDIGVMWLCWAEANDRPNFKEICKVLKKLNDNP